MITDFAREFIKAFTWTDRMYITKTNNKSNYPSKEEQEEIINDYLNSINLQVKNDN